jgi:hypothetical protein
LLEAADLVSWLAAAEPNLSDEKRRRQSDLLADRAEVLP